MAEPSPAGPGEVGITIVRVFDAPRERVWREWIEPASFADWFGGRDGEVPLSTVSMDSASVYFHTRTMQAFANGDTGGGASQQYRRLDAEVSVVAVPRDHVPRHADPAVVHAQRDEDLVVCPERPGHQ